MPSVASKPAGVDAANLTTDQTTRRAKERFIVELESSGDDERPPIVRLRAALKLFKRMFNLRCAELRTATGAPLSQESPDSEGT